MRLFVRIKSIQWLIDLINVVVFYESALLSKKSSDDFLYFFAYENNQGPKWIGY